MTMSDPPTEEPDYLHYVVTAGVGDEVSGYLAGYVTRSRLRPVRFVVCVSLVNHTFTVAEKGNALGERSERVLPVAGAAQGGGVPHMPPASSRQATPYRRCHGPAETSRLGAP
jgi:hypothetical protein